MPKEFLQKLQLLLLPYKKKCTKLLIVGRKGFKEMSLSKVYVH